MDRVARREAMAMRAFCTAISTHMRWAVWRGSWIGTGRSARAARLSAASSSAGGTLTRMRAGMGCSR